MPSRPPETPDRPAGERSAALRVLVGLLLVEAAFLLVLALVLAVDLVTRHRQTQLWVPVSETGLSLLVVIALVLMARGLARERRWARSPAITLQLVGLPFAGRLIEFGGIRIVLGVPMGLVLLATLVLLFATASPAAYLPKDQRTDHPSEPAAGPDSD